MLGEYLSQKESAEYLGITARNFLQMKNKGYVKPDKKEGRCCMYSVDFLNSVRRKFSDLIRKYKDRAGSRHEMPRPKLDDIETMEQLHGDPDFILDPVPAAAVSDYPVQRGFICAKCRYFRRLRGTSETECAKFHLTLEKENPEKCGCHKFAPVKESGKK